MEFLPSTRFQGSKRKILPVIYELIIETLPNKPKILLDLFGGSGICSLFFLQKGINVIYNDNMKFNYYNAHGLLRNEIPSEDEIDKMFVETETDDYVSEIFRDIYYIDEENHQIDLFRKNIKKLKGNKKKIMYYLFFQSLISKRPYNLFHRKNLNIRTSDVKRSFGNKTTWEKSFQDHMKKFRKELLKIKDLKKESRIINYSYNNISEKYIKIIDTVYIDPPYFKKDSPNSQYIDQYHFLEGMVMKNWDDLIDHDSINKRFMKTDRYIIESPKKMFSEIFDTFIGKTIIISYNDDSYPSVEWIKNTLSKKYENVIVKYIDYQYALSKKKNKEVLIIAHQ